MQKKPKHALYSLLDSTATVFLVIVKFQNILLINVLYTMKKKLFLVPLFTCRLC